MLKIKQQLIVPSSRRQSQTLLQLFRNKSISSNICIANSQSIASNFKMSISSNEISTKRPSITHIIFDMDGLLIDTENFYSQVQEVILARFGKTFDWSLKAKMMGKKAIESAKIFVEESGISDSLTPQQFLVEREDMLQSLFPTCNLMPGVSRLVNHFHTSGIPMAVATGSHKRHFELKTQNHGDIFSVMHHIVLGDDPDVKKGKPSPDIFLAAARRFEDVVDPTKILVFEDAPAGVGAAKNAGM
ncbi:(DL)-glycerol-3-phosphatase [Thalictrum thalictroides]|uniref:glycerol-1-phosphatase n=1 Tax=Thalictrum thalictroides TaxID=46969 RepID=A0A7J6WHG3_THATH|nr:(DL)-glycerol-3-phosphatase [Thalictrum thalictroides]